jgi:hypothetical protein
MGLTMKFPDEDFYPKSNPTLMKPLDLVRVGLPMLFESDYDLDMVPKL